MDVQLPSGDTCKFQSQTLEHTFSDSLHIQETENSENCSVWDRNIDEELNYLDKKSNQNLKKCPTFPHTGKLLHSSSSDEEEEEANASVEEPLCDVYPHKLCSRSFSLPIPDKLASAMKGSRQKRGLEPVKLTVKWAPDVYDPEPNSLSHTVKGKKQHKSKNNRNGKNEKKGKKGQKGSTNRGGSGKDKKQYSKYGGSSLMCYTKKLDGRDKLVSVH